MYDYGDVENPSPFAESYDFYYVTINDGVTSIGAYMFNSYNMFSQVSLPSSLKVIEVGAFNGCSNLEVITIPDLVEIIKDYAFNCCSSLPSLVFPSSLRLIGDSAFSYCSQMSTVQIPKNIQTIDRFAFEYCGNLTVNFTGSPADWKKISIDDDAFEGTTLTVNYYYGVEGVENAINDIGANDGTDAYLARIVAAVAAYEKLTDAQKNKVINADELYAAMYGFPDMEFGVCGDCVGYAWNRSAGKVVIGGCGAMYNYYYPDNASPFVSSGDVSTVVIANGVTSVGSFAFAYCQGLTSVTFPGDGAFTVIEDAAFISCRELDSVNLPQGLTTIAASAFAVTGLTNVTLPGTVTKLAQYAFDGVPATSVTLPKSLAAIPAYASLYNDELQSLNYTGSPADWAAMTIDQDAFFNASLSTPTCYYYGVEGTINAIDDIGTVEYTDACKERIDAARKAYDRLSDYETTLVTNHDDLLAAEEKYAQLAAAAVRIPGDANHDGQLDMADVLAINYYLAHVSVCDFDVSDVDVNGNSIIDGGDAEMI